MIFKLKNFFNHIAKKHFFDSKIPFSGYSRLNYARVERDFSFLTRMVEPMRYLEIMNMS